MRTGASLVERRRELALLRRAAERSRSGHGRVVLVGGESGSGKTALVEATLQSDRLLVLRGTAPAVAPAPLAALVAAIRSHPDWPAPGRLEVDPGWQPFLRATFPELAAGTAPGDETGSAQLLVDALRGLVLTMARREPLALVLDDLHQADEATLGVFLALATAAQTAPLLLIGVYRTNESAPDSAFAGWRRELQRKAHLETIVLEPLSTAGVATLTGRLLGGAIPPALADWMMARTGGLPLFVEEVAAALRSEHSVRHGASGLELEREDLPLPSSLRDAVLVRVERLPEAARRRLAIAAIAGGAASADLVDSVADALSSADARSPEAAPAGWLRTAEDLGLVVASAGDQIVFRHDLVQRALAGILSGGELRAVHHAIAAQLESGHREGRSQQPLVVAEHWLAAGEAPRAARSYLKAAEEFRRVHAYRDAAAAIRRALAAGLPPEIDEIDALERLADSEELAGEVAAATGIWERAAAARGSGRDWTRAGHDARRWASLLELRGHWEQAIEARRQAAVWFVWAERPGDAAAEHLAAATHLRSAAAFTAALELLGSAATEAQAAGRVDLEARISGLEGNVLTRMGRADQGLARVRHGLQIALDAGLSAPSAELYQRLADSLEHAGSYADAKATYLEGAEYCRRQSIEASAQLCLACLGVVLFQTGEWTVAERSAREVIASGHASAHALAVAEGVLGLVEAMRGTPSRARPHLHASLTLARHIELAAMELISLAGVARCEAADGHVEAAADRARELLTRWERTEERHYSVPLLRWAAMLHARAGDATAVRSCASALARIAAETAQPEALAALGSALGEAALLEGDCGRAVDHLASALELVSARNLPLDRSEIGWRTGVALVGAGRREDGVRAMVQAHRTARRLGAAQLATSIAGDLRSLGEPLERRLGRRETERLTAAGLTGREVEVMRLVAQGHTSRAIGEALFISPRTAEMHVASAIAKLDCRTRAEAAHRAAALGLLA